MTEPAVLADGDALVEYYEALRNDVMAGAGGARTLHGRALLMFKGMATWMQSINEVPLRTVMSVGTNDMRLPMSIEQNLVNIVATMAFITSSREKHDGRDALESTGSTPEAKRLSIRAAVNIAAGL